MSSRRSVTRGEASLAAIEREARVLLGPAIVDAPPDADRLEAMIDRAIETGTTPVGPASPWIARLSLAIGGGVVVLVAAVLAARPEAPAFRAAPRADERPVPSAPISATPPSEPSLPASSSAIAGPSASPSAAPPPRIMAERPSTSPRPRAPGELAPDLFRRANALRDGGEVDRARAVYERIVERFPHSREASVSLVTLGTLHLERLDDPRRALAYFGRYLAGSRSGVLAEKALVGRARALAALGDEAAEREAWRELAERFPDSMHAALARRRAGATSDVSP